MSIGFPTPGQSRVARRMRKANDRLQKSLAEYKALRDESPVEDLQRYGGKDFPRHLSLVITSTEQALLWAGDLIPVEEVED